jgi:uncharacterized spore protein YtfJ
MPTNDNTNFQQNIDTLFSDLHQFIKTDTVLGTPTPVGDKTLIPLMSVTLGYGSTGMGKSPNTNTSMSSGIGLGARVSTNAVMVIDKNSVNMYPVGEKSNMGQIMEKVPQAIASMTQGGGIMGQGQQQQQGQQAQQGGQQGGQQGSQQGGQQSK